jgi:hypothetical protein
MQPLHPDYLPPLGSSYVTCLTPVSHFQAAKDAADSRAMLGVVPVVRLGPFDQ